jgi:hypothetical protein
MTLHIKHKTLAQIEGHARDHAAYGWTPKPWAYYGVNTTQDVAAYMGAYKAQCDSEAVRATVHADISAAGAALGVHLKPLHKEQT